MAENDLKLAKAVTAAAKEIRRQAEDGKPGPYFDDDNLGDALIDGRVDLIAVVRAALSA